MSELSCQLASRLLLGAGWLLVWVLEVNGFLDHVPFSLQQADLGLFT